MKHHTRFITNKLKRTCYRFKYTPVTILGPVVQNIVSLMKSLGSDSLSLKVLIKFIAVRLFLLKKLSVAFALQKLLTFFRQKKKMPEFFAFDTLKNLTPR